MKQYLVFAGITSLVLTISGCASITQGTSQTLTFNLEPKEITKSDC
jgi:hypothetical protein